MTPQEKVAVIRLNTDEPVGESCYSNEDLLALLKANNDSVNFVSYQLCLKKSRDDSITLGPISIKTDPDYWLNLAQMFLQLHQQEQIEDENNRNRGGTQFMQRADEIW